MFHFSPSICRSIVRRLPVLVCFRDLAQLDRPWLVGALVFVAVAMMKCTPAVLVAPPPLTDVVSPPSADALPPPLPLPSPPTTDHYRYHHLHTLHWLAWIPRDTCITYGLCRAFCHHLVPIIMRPVPDLQSAWASFLLLTPSHREQISTGADGGE